MFINRVEQMQVADINHIADVIYMEGCHNQCPFCFNKELWEFKHNVNIDTIISQLSDIEYVCISGGEPLEQVNDLIELLKRIPQKKVVLFTSGLTVIPEYTDSIYGMVQHIHLDIKPIQLESPHHLYPFRNKISLGIVADPRCVDFIHLYQSLRTMEGFGKYIRFYIKPLNGVINDFTIKLSEWIRDLGYSNIFIGEKIKV